MGGIPTPAAATAVAQAATEIARPALRISMLMAQEMGPTALKALQAQMLSTVEAETGAPHHWRQLPDVDAIELVPKGATE